MRDASVVEVDLSAIARNMGVLRHLVGPDCAICPVVKADAYGLGAVRVAKCLQQAGAEMLAVYTAEQAASLLRAAISGPLLVLMPLREIGRAGELYRGLVCGRLHLSLHDGDHLEDLLRLTESYALTLPLHLEVDTGMSRGGCNLGEAPAVLARIAREPRLRLAGIYTHFASAEGDEDLTQTQDDRFGALLRAHEDLVPPDCIIHAANTCATLRAHRYHKTMVRVGQAWAGYGPESVCSGTILPGAEHLTPAVTWSSRLIHVKRITAGTRVGYGSSGSTWRASRDSVIGLVPVGYADGYPLALTGPADATVPAQSSIPCVAVLLQSGGGDERREYVPLAGRISMDQLTVDLTDICAANPGAVRVGTPVELISPDRSAPNHLARIAVAARTNPYEILCRMNPRIRRIYHQAMASVETVARPAAAAAAG